jgi:hypothetical protein
MAPSEQSGASVAKTTVPMQHYKQQMAKAYRWYEVVRCLRAFYDHFRIAFPHLEELPMGYTDDWAEQFKETAREFVRTENMESVQKVLTGAGYGTEKWVQISAREAAEIEQAFARLVQAVEHIDEEIDEEFETENASSPIETKIIPLKPDAESDDTLKALQEKYNGARKENKSLESDIEKQRRRIVELEGHVRRQNSKSEEPEVAQRCARLKKMTPIKNLKRFKSDLSKQRRKISDSRKKLKYKKSTSSPLRARSDGLRIPMLNPIETRRPCTLPANQNPIPQR